MRAAAVIALPELKPEQFMPFNRDTYMQCINLPPLQHFF